MHCFLVEAMSAKETNPSLSSSGMGGKETSGSVESPLRAPRPPRAPIPRPPSFRRLIGAGWMGRIEQWSARAPIVDWLYLGAVGAVVVLAGCILAIG
jgi:hypothetical protein